MLRKYSPLAHVLESLGYVSGRRKLQKIVYLAQAKGGAFEERFKYHFYGPYSETLAAEIEEMRTLGLLRETLVSGQGRPDSHEYCEYRLTPEGQAFLEELTPSGADEGIGVDPGFLARMNAKPARELELLAALHYLLVAGMDADDAMDAVRKHKAQQGYTEEECKNALAELCKEGLMPTPVGPAVAGRAGT